MATTKSRQTKKTSSGQEKKETRERILAAARAEFAQKGFAGARMEAIARKARANKAMLHYYFGSKKNLYARVLKQIFMVREDKPIPIDFDQWNITPAQKLHLVVSHLVDVHCGQNTDPQFHQIMAWEVAEGRKMLKSFAREYFIPRFKKVETIIKEGIKAGEFETPYPILVVWDLISFFIGYGMHRETYAGTELEKPLYKDISKDKMRSFIVQHVFKALAVGGQVKIPEVPPEITEELKQIVAAEKKYLE